ncbi:MAG TPA: hypothetical protein PKO06_19450, partial [Candidatus Ozemobacteraceae bacterium]|nr:hypothetical protein [Candidatus Ozemobacteraceae bacterium]
PGIVAALPAAGRPFDQLAAVAQAPPDGPIQVVCANIFCEKIIKAAASARPVKSLEFRMEIFPFLK